jgi:hypothetical protein
VDTVDTKDWGGFEAVFATDAVADYTPPGGKPRELIVTGSANIVAFVKRVIAPAITMHHGHMPEIEVILPETATGIWSMENSLWWPKDLAARPYGVSAITTKLTKRPVVDDRSRRLN